MAVIYLKAVEEKQRISRIHATQYQVLRFGFIQAARNSTLPNILKEVGAQAVRGNIEYALRIADGFAEQVANSLAHAFVNAGGRESDTWTKRLQITAKAGETFDITDPEVVTLMQRHKLNTVQNLTRQQRDLIRQALITGIRKGQTADQIARRFRNMLGLTTAQLDLVDRYQAALEATSSAAMNFRARDVSLDNQLQRAIDENDVLTATQIERMVGRYTDNLRAYRAEVIAQTESLKMVNQARNLGFRQAVTRAGLDPSEGTKTWLHTSSQVPREDHLAMVGTTVAMNDAFELPSGARMLYPGDGSLGAGPDEIVNCKCGIEYKIGEQ